MVDDDWIDVVTATSIWFVELRSEMWQCAIFSPHVGPGCQAYGPALLHGELSMTPNASPSGHPTQPTSTHWNDDQSMEQTDQNY